MIHYALRCADGHEFDGWFASSTAFDRQAQARLVECPVCGAVQVSRALMAPALARGAAPEILPPPPSPAAAPGPAAPPAAVLATLQRMRAVVEANAENVGDDFVAMARAMHAGEIESRGIYGNSTEDEARSLLEEGVTITRIPWVPRADS